MDFTEVYKHTNYLSRFSPDSLYLATGVHSRVVIRNAVSLQIIHIFQSSGAISNLEWAPNSQLIAASTRDSVLHVWNLHTKDIQLHIDLGPLGFDAIVWNPNSLYVLAFAEFQTRVYICSIKSPSIIAVEGAKYSEKCSIFRRDGKIAAIMIRRHGKNAIAIYNTLTWKQIKIFTPDTDNVEGLSWSPDGHCIAVWQNSIDYKLLFYSLDGRRIAHRSLREDYLGIRNLVWHPQGRFLAVSTFDNIVRIYGMKTWDMQCEFTHPNLIKQKDVRIWREPRDPRKEALNQVLAPGSRGIMTFDSGTVPMSLAITSTHASSTFLRMGIGMMEMSPDGQYLATRADETSSFIVIWQFNGSRALDLGSSNPQIVALVQFLQPVRCMRWSPKVNKTLGNQLAIACSTDCLYFWTEGLIPVASQARMILDDSAFDRTDVLDHRIIKDLEEERRIDTELAMQTQEAIAVDLPLKDFSTNAIEWRKDGRALVLMNRDAFCCTFILDDDQDSGFLYDLNLKEQLNLSDY